MTSSEDVCDDHRELDEEEFIIWEEEFLNAKTLVNEFKSKFSNIMTLTAGAATALRGVATLKARAMKEVWNIASVIPMDKGLTSTGGCSNVNGSNGSSSSSHSGELIQQENFLGTCSREWLARGCELLKRTRKGDLAMGGSGFLLPTFCSVTKIPCLKTIGRLFRCNILLNQEAYALSFYTGVMDSLAMELRASKYMAKLKAGIRILGYIASVSEQPISKQAFSQLLAFLAHRYPK